MREVEIKAWAENPEGIKAHFDNLAGEGGEVHKMDRYFRRPGEKIQAFRIRCFDGKVELTAKKTSSGPDGENNEEYEFRALPDQSDAATAFFHALGYEDFFIKKKDGYEWYCGRAHVELLSVNTLGWFIEIEILIPFDSDDDAVAAARNEIISLLSDAGVGEEDYESRSYRDMILEKEGGIQSKSYTR